MATLPRTLIFVHGTGVREERYNSNFADITRRLAMISPESTPVRCLWGETEGCKLRSGGKSIPEYETARDMFSAEEDPSNALWWMLYQDPLFELQLLSRNDAGSDAFDLQAETAIEAGIELLTRNDTDVVTAAVQDAGLALEWSAAKSELAGSSAVVEALARFLTMTADVRMVLARAVVARAIQMAPSGQVVSGDLRDQLVDRLADSWGGEERAFGWAKAALTRVAMHIATGKLKRERGAVSDAAYPAAGDILLYQRRGDGIRHFIRRTIEKAEPPVAVLAHSLGGIACVDLFCEPDAPSVEWLITAGSQASLLYELDALAGMRHGDSLPESFPKNWLNLYDLRDFLSYVSGEIFKGRVVDVKVDNGQPFPQSHSAYWTNPMVWDAIIRWFRAK
jgi:hypothetical protein